jgi:hypothetical protein
LPKQESSSEDEEEQPQQGNSFMDFWRNTWIRKTGIFAQFLLDFLIFFSIFDPFIWPQNIFRTSMRLKGKRKELKDISRNIP